LATRIDLFSSQHLEAACRVLADTERGLSGTQIERLLQEIEVADTSPGITKWKRLFNALAGAQNGTSLCNRRRLQIRHRIHVAQHPGIIARQGRGRRLLQQGAGTDVALQAG